MAFLDNRQFIEALDKSGDLVHIKQEVDWDLEVGAIVRRAGETQSPAALFEKIKDYPEGFRILGTPLGTFRRIAIAMGLVPDTPFRNILHEFERRVEQPVKPKVVKDGACKENILLGDDVDLYRFPVPMVHDGDGGRYIGTWHLTACKDPDSDWTNWAMIRNMVYNERYLGWFSSSINHFRMILYEKYLARNTPMPVAVAIGADPLCSIIAATTIGKGESEVDYAGALRQEPVELIKCETNDLLVPAHAEIILEGEVLPDKTLLEGPFGEYTGYRSPQRLPIPAIRVNAITYRNDPILTMSCPGILMDDNFVPYLGGAVMIKRYLQKHGVPVTDVYLPPGMPDLAVVGVRKGGMDITNQIASLLMARRVLMVKVIVVDEDIDVFNLGEVLHAFATKCHPIRGIKASEHDRANALNPYLSPEERKARRGAAVVFDCTWPVDWSRESEVPLRSSFANIYPSEIKEKVLTQWASYGFK